MAPNNAIPYQYWRNPSVMSSYDAFDRRGSIYGVPSASSLSYLSSSSSAFPQNQQLPLLGPHSPNSLLYGSSGGFAGAGAGPESMYAPRTAYAKLKSKDSKVEGEVRFVQTDNRFVGVTGRIVGLTPGPHGLHVHELPPSVSSSSSSGGSEEKEAQPSCDSIGPHLNPTSSDHGGKSEWKRHVSHPIA